MHPVRLHVNQLELAVDVGGPSSGPTVLLLHAGAENRGVWLPIAPLLNDAGWRTIAPDLRGHGESGRAPAYRLDDMLDDNEAIIRQLAGEPLVIAGGSIGGVIGLLLMGERSLPAAGLALLDLPTRPRSAPVRAIRERVATARSRGSKAIASVDPGFMDGTFVDDVMAESHRWWQAARRLQSPTLLIRGTRGAMSGEMRRQFLEDIPHAEIAEVDAGHLVARDQPAAVAVLLQSFLNRFPVV